MKHTYQITTKDNTKLYNVSWMIDNPKATILFVHGYAEHIERYNWEAEQFNKAGYNVFGYDHRAHGRSDGKDCYLADFDDNCKDLKEVIRYINPKHDFFIYAHSVGALITVKYLMDFEDDTVKQVKGCVFTGAALKISEDLSPMLQKVAGILGRIAPRLKTTKLPAEGMSKVPEEVEKYNSDPYNYRGGTYASTGFQLLRATKRVATRLSEIKIPFLAMHGGDDGITDKQGSIMLHDLAASSDKTLNIWEGLAHEISRSYDKVDVLKTMTDWVDKRV